MAMDLREAVASGLLVEFQDARGNLVGQSVYFDWHGKPLPNIGDTLSCRLSSPPGSRQRQLAGRVRSRFFDVQTDDAGEPCVWVRVLVDTQPISPLGRGRLAPSAGMFSAN